MFYLEKNHRLTEKLQVQFFPKPFKDKLLIKSPILLLQNLSRKKFFDNEKKASLVLSY